METTPSPDGGPPARPGPSLPLTLLVVAVCTAVAVGLRQPTFGRPASIDEAGYLMVGGGWHAGGSSLYGDYWVDRPPLLVGLFQLASTLGGLTALRVLGCVATGATVLLTAATASRIAGRRAACVSALAAAGWLVTTHLDAQVVDGELLAAPFVAAGMGAVAVAATASRLRVALTAAALAGAAVVAAVMVKQNMVDAAVLGVVVLVVSVLRRRLTLSRALALAGGTLAGAVAAGGAVALWAVSRGTSLSELWYALYPFRIDARRVLGLNVSTRAVARKRALLDDILRSGLVLAAVAALIGVVRTRLDPFVTGLLAVLCYDVVSVAGGDGAWQHYLVEAIVPASLVLGILVDRLWGVGLVAVVVAVAALLTFDPSPVDREKRQAGAVGEVIAHSSEPGDSLVALYGRPGVNLGAGLPSPYPYFWALPIRVRDPELSGLVRVLEGPQAPTWVVVWTAVGFDHASRPLVEAALREHYRPFGDLDGHQVLLHDGLERPPLSS